MADKKVQALRDFVYDDVVGLVRTGQVFTLRGRANDARLLAHRFVDEFTGKAVTDDQGREFAAEWQRERAGAAQSPVPPALAERRAQPARVLNVGG